MHTQRRAIAVEVWLLRALFLALVGFYGGVWWLTRHRPLQGDQWTLVWSTSFVLLTVLGGLTLDRYWRQQPSLWTLAWRWDD